MAAACLDRMEELSAWMDGEATPAETIEVESHLRTCPGCRQTYQLMAQAGSTVARLEIPAAPCTDYAKQVRAAVQPPRLSWLRRLRWPDHPIGRLAGRKAKPGASMLSVLGLFGVPALLFACFDFEQARIFLSIAAAGLLVGLPVQHFRTEVSLLTSLRRGRALEEVLSTGMPASSLVDTLAVQSLGTVARASLPLVPILALGSRVFPAESQTLALEGSLAWLPAVLALFWLGSYVVLFLATWARSGESSSPAQQVLAAGVLLPSVALGCLAWFHPVFLACALLYAGLTSRALAIWGLTHPATVEQVNHRRIVGRRNDWLVGSAENPIIARETARRAATVPGGLLGLIAWRALPVALPLAWALALLNTGDWAAVYWTGAALTALFAFARAAGHTLGAVVGERQRGTWESLVQTAMTREEFMSGWVVVAVGPVALELLPAVVLMAAVPLVLPLSAVPPIGILAAGVVALMAVVGAHAGLAVSTRSATLGEANSRQITLAGYLGLGWLIAYGSLSTALNWMALQGWLDSSHSFWQAMMQELLPVASLSLAALGALHWSFGVIASELTFGNAAPSATPVTSSPRGRRLVLCSCVAAGVTCAVALDFWTNVFTPELLGTVVLAGCVGWLAGALGCWLGAPLLNTVSRRVSGSPLAIVAGGVAGAFSGAAVSLLPLLGHTLSWAGSLPATWSGLEKSYWRPELLFYCAGAAALTGALLGVGLYLEREGEGSTEPLGLALRRTALRVLLSGTALVCVGTALVGHILLFQPRDPALGERVLAETRARLASQAQPPFRVDVEAATGAFNLLRSDRASSLQAVRRNGPALARFEAQLPALRAMQGIPAFALAPAPPTREFLNYRSVGGALAMLGLSQQDRGRTEEALETYLLAFDWANRMPGRGALIHEMVGLASLNRATRGLLDLMQGSLPAAAYRRILERTSASRFTPESFGRCMDNEFASALAYIHAAREGTLDDPEAKVVRFLPGFYFDYQARLYTDLYLEERAACYSLGDTTQVLSRLGRSRSAQLVSMLFPNAHRAIRNYQMGMTDLGAVRVVASLRLYRSTHGHYPATLAELGSLPRDYTNVEGTYHYTRQGDSFVLLSGHGVSQRRQFPPPGDEL